MAKEIPWDRDEAAALTRALIADLEAADPDHYPGAIYAAEVLEGLAEAVRTRSPPPKGMLPGMLAHMAIGQWRLGFSDTLSLSARTSQAERNLWRLLGGPDWIKREN